MNKEGIINEIEVDRMLEGEKIDIQAIFDEKVILRDYISLSSSFHEGNYVIMQIQRRDQEGLSLVTTGSKIIVKNVEDNKDLIPFYMTIVERVGEKGRTYYCFE